MRWLRKTHKELVYLAKIRLDRDIKPAPQNTSGEYVLVRTLEAEKNFSFRRIAPSEEDGLARPIDRQLDQSSSNARSLSKAELQAARNKGD